MPPPLVSRPVFCTPAIVRRALFGADQVNPAANRALHIHFGKKTIPQTGY
jgi:hypothetical protein